MYERFADFCSLIRDLTEEENPWLLLPVGFLISMGVLFAYGADLFVWVIVVGGTIAVTGLLALAHLLTRGD